MRKSFGVIATLLFLIPFTEAFGQEGIFEDFGFDIDGRIVIITGAGGGLDVNYCTRDLKEYNAVIQPRGGHPAIVTTVAIRATTFVVSAGDRFDISSSIGCGGGRIVTQLTLKGQR